MQYLIPLSGVVAEIPTSSKAREISAHRVHLSVTAARTVITAVVLVPFLYSYIGVLLCKQYTDMSPNVTFIGTPADIRYIVVVVANIRAARPSVAWRFRILVMHDSHLIPDHYS